jgi:NAD(P)-dependent dehydrogenase (short-subunit alcohol dehydrogenase family)
VGRAVAQAFARDGARLCLVARGADRLESARREVLALGGEAVTVVGDVADPALAPAVAAAAENAFGPIDVWINNAMVSVFSPIASMTPAEFRRVTEVTYLGVVYGTLAALARMRLRDRGVIVQVGSALAYRGIPLQSAYCAAKHAIQGFVESLRCELLHDRSAVRVTMVQLPALNTPQFDWVRSRLPRRAQPVPPIYQPEVAARAIVWASRAPRREIAVGWPALKAIYGNAIAPGYADRVLAWHGYAAQQTGEPERSRPDNLCAAPPGDPGAHGRFDHRASTRCTQLWLSMHRRALAFGVVLAALAGVALWRARTGSADRAGGAA